MSHRTRHEREVSEVVDVLLEIDAHKSYGAPYTREEVALILEWPISKLDRVIRWLREHPEYGVAVTWRPGPQSGVIVSSTDDPIFGDTLKTAQNFGDIWKLSNLKRLVRSIVTDLMHIKNADRSMLTSTEKRQITMRRRSDRGMLDLILAGYTQSSNGNVEKYIEKALETL